MRLITPSIDSSVSQCGTLALATILLLDCGFAYGTGFFINQQSVRGLGRVNAGVVAAADDAATVFFNPAGLTQLWQDDNLPAETDSLVSLGVHLIRPRADLSDTGSVAATPGTLGALLPYAGPNAENPTDPTPVPNFYFARRLATAGPYVGVGITSPFGLSSEFDSDWFGRYDATEASLKTINLGLVGAFQLNDILYLGGGIDLQYARTKLTSAIPNPFTLGGPTAVTDARTELSGDAWTPGFNIGVIATPDDITRVGLSYRSGFNHRLSGEAETTGFTGLLASANGVVDTHADLKLPAMASAAVSRQVSTKLALFGQLDWYDWSSFDRIRVQFDDGRPDAVRAEDYRDTWAVSFGADYEMHDNLVLRGGIRFDQTPTVDSARDTVVPDADRFWMGIGATYRHSARTSFDFAFTHVLFDEANVDVTRSFADIGSAVRVKSDVDTHVNTIAASVNFAF